MFSAYLPEAVTNAESAPASIRWVNMGNDTYSQYRDHPLRDVPQGVLDAARDLVKSCVKHGDVEEYIAEPLADSVVQAIVTAGYRFCDEETW